MKRKAETLLTPEILSEILQKGEDQKQIQEHKQVQEPQLAREALKSQATHPIQKQVKKMVQMSLMSFTKDKQVSVEPFVPIDRVSEAKGPTPKKKVGRPRKYPQSAKIEIDVEVLPDPIINNETNEEHSEKMKRARYQKIPYKTKLNILTQFVDFEKNPSITKNGKLKSFDEFCHEIGNSLRVQWSTVKSLCRAYTKKNSLLTQLQIICSNKQDANQCGQISVRKPRLTYPDEMDLDIADWVYACIDLGYIITREVIREKAKEVICSVNENFRGSDQC